MASLLKELRRVVDSEVVAPVRTAQRVAPAPTPREAGAVRLYDIGGFGDVEREGCSTPFQDASGNYAYASTWWSTLSFGPGDTLVAWASMTWPCGRTLWGGEYLTASMILMGPGAVPFSPNFGSFPSLTPGATYTTDGGAARYTLVEIGDGHARVMYSLNAWFSWSYTTTNRWAVNYGGIADIPNPMGAPVGTATVGAGFPPYPEQHWCGCPAPGVTTDHEEYSPPEQAWRDREELPSARMRHAAAVVDDAIYVLGGVDSG